MSVTRGTCTWGVEKSLARPERKQGNVSVRMEWISFGALPCRKRNLMTARVSMLYKPLKCFQTCFLPGRAKNLSAPLYNHAYCHLSQGYRTVFLLHCSKVCCTVPEPFLGVSRQNIRGKVKCWMENQHLVLCRGPRSTQRQAGELISGPNLATRARLLPFNRTQSRAVFGLLIRHNT